MARGRPLEVEQELLEAFRRSGRVSEYLVRVLPARIWRAAPPAGRGRSIAAIVAHMQSIRRVTGDRLSTTASPLWLHK
jgi:hypothetical protein